VPNNVEAEQSVSQYTAVNSVQRQFMSSAESTCPYEAFEDCK